MEENRVEKKKREHTAEQVTSVEMTDTPKAKKKEHLPEKKKQKKTRRRRGKKILLTLLVLILAAAAGGGIYLLTPSKKQVDHKAYFGLADGVAYGLIVNQERVGSYPVKRSGYWYLDFDTVYAYVCDKFYYDGVNVLYTNPTKTFFAKPDTYQYTDDAERSYKLDYQPCYQENGKLYIALEYMKLMDFSYYLADTDRQYVWIWNNWSELNTAKVKKDSALRYGSSIKMPVVDNAAEGETVIILEEGTAWDMVQSERGWIGCIKKSVLEEQTVLMADTPDNRPLPVYTTRMLDETVCMAWHQVFTESGYKKLDDLLENTEGINVLSPTWFTICDNEGNIKSLADEKYVEKAHDLGIQVWGLVENINIEVDETLVLGVTAHRKNLIDALMKEAKRVDLDGINVDLEAVGEVNGPHLLQFIREMSAACRKNGLVLSVDNYSPMPHTAFYDRRQQAEIVDYVIVMAYDENYSGDTTAGSTASLNWIHQSSERTLQEVPKEKLIVGLPTYTRLWKGTDGAGLKSEGIGMEACDKIVKENKLSMTWLEDLGQHYVEYTADGIPHRLWIEDEKSMELKLDAAFSYEPAGVAFFKLGLESDDIWVHVNKYLD